MTRIKYVLRSATCSFAVMLAVLFVSGCASSTAERYRTLEQEAVASGFSVIRFGGAPPGAWNVAYGEGV